MLYKVGDKVRIKRWDDLLEAGGILFRGGYIELGDTIFGSHMRDLCGTNVELEYSDAQHYEYCIGDFYLSDWMIEGLAVPSNQMCSETSQQQTITMDLLCNEDAVALIKFLTILEFDIEMESVGDCYKIKAKRGKE